MATVDQHQWATGVPVIANPYLKPFDVFMSEDRVVVGSVDALVIMLDVAKGRALKYRRGRRVFSASHVDFKGDHAVIRADNLKRYRVKWEQILTPKEAR